MKKSFFIFLLVTITVSLFCSSDETNSNSVTSPSFNDPNRSSINKELLVGSWTLGSLKTVKDDGTIYEEPLTFAQTLDINNDLTFNLQNQAGPLEFEHLEGQWTSTSGTIQLLFIENNSIYLIDDYEYTVTGSVLELLLLSDTHSETGSLLFTYQM